MAETTWTQSAGMVSDEDTDNLEGYADQAEASKDAAAVSAAAAEAAKVAAAASEAAALASKNSAATSATTATTGAATATTKASEAAASAASASTSATAAQTAQTAAEAAEASETASASSAAAASTSETNAATSASAASTSETNAATSASAASTSETNAATSASAASTSATAAQTAQTAAELAETNAEAAETNAAASATSANASALAALASEIAAGSSETNAAASETAASTSETNAAASASAASTSETNAATSETNAANSATASASSATASAASATAASASETAAAASETAAAASETAAATSETNAATSATSAAGSASAASTSASNAAASESNAASSASAASTSETNAAASEAAASTSETNAATSETNAANSATASAASATASAGSATASASSATAAAASETAAAASEGNAATSASNAATSATNAATSETNASTSATAAASSASSASASADAALAALDSFDDRYLGQKASDPTLDNDGNPLVAGALYFNTTDDIMKVYDGAAWLAAYASLSGALLAANNLSDVLNAATARTNLGLGTAATTASTDYATAAQGALADSAIQTGDSPSFGSVTVSGTVDGRDVAADGSKLDGIEAGADVTDTGSVTTAGALMDSEVTNLAQVKAFDSADYATAAQGSLADSAVQPNDSPSFVNVTVSGTVDGRDVAADGSKLDGIETGATADQTAGEIKAAYESNANTNAYTDAEKSKLAGIEAGAEVNTVDSINTQTGSVVLDADDISDAATTNKFTTAAEISKLAGIEAGADVTDTANVTAAGALMDSEVTNLAQVKAFSSADYATAAQGSLADSALQSGDNVSALTNDAGYTTNVGDITGVTAGSGISGGGTSGTVTVAHADTSSQGSVNNSGATFIQDVTVDTYGHVTALGSATISPATIGAATSAQGALADSALQSGDNISALTNDAGYTTNVGDITNVSAGTGLSGGGASGSVTLNVDLSELTDMTATMVGTDEFIVLDAGADRRKAANEIGLSIFSNDAGFTTNVGDITGVTAGSGISGGGTSGTVTVSHADTSSQGSVNNSGTTVIQDITLDTYGHITAIGSTTLSIPAAYTNSSVDSHLNTGTATSNQVLSWSGSDYDWVDVGGGNPASTIIYVAQNTAPTGYLKANGAAISRTTYADLFAAIGTTFGTGDGSTTFNLPDLRGEFIRAWDDARGVDSGRSFGSAQADELKSHGHRQRVGRGFADAQKTIPGSAFFTDSTISGTQETAYTGGTETRPRNIALLACIKY
jgi:microcystin-dependent protein